MMPMEISILLNGIQRRFEVTPGEKLLSVLRRSGFRGVKSGGCTHGECGACTVLMDGKPVSSCMLLAAQADGHAIQTIEALGQQPDQGWKKTAGADPIQQAFIETGAVQCGYCTPGQILAAKALLQKNLHPTEAEVREALSGVLCRCTGYRKPVQAVLRAAGVLRGEKLAPFIASNSSKKRYQRVGNAENKIDAFKLALGKPVFTDDVELPGTLIAKVLHSPYAHARIKSIDASKARALEGVAAVLTWRDLPRVVYSTAGQSDPIPGPLDSFSLDNKVRFVGDRVAFVAAETEEIAKQALGLIDVQYEVLPSVLDPEQATQEGAPVIHDEPEYQNFSQSNPRKNIAAQMRIDIGDVEQGFREADLIVEGDYEVPKVQQAHIEPHVAISYWDEDDRLVIRTSTQVPFHVRRQLAPILGLPVKRIRVIKPRIGGGFGGKQEVLLEDVVAHLTIATGRPVKYEYTREDEFIASRSRHPMRFHMKTGVKKDGTITANEMYCLSDTGAYGCHALTVTGNSGHKPMALYVGDGKYRENPNIRFYADVVYTNHPPAGAFRGYGVPQGFWAVDRHLEKVAHRIGMDPLEFRLKNAIRKGEWQPSTREWSEGHSPKAERIQSIGLEECVRQGKKAIDWDNKYGNPEWHTVPGKEYLRRGIGVALAMHGTAISYVDMGSASIKMNEDGSFNLLIGATDLGTGSDTVLAQMVAEVLGVPVEDLIVYSSDTDFTPFDKGAYASSTTYISGTAVAKAAEKVAEQIRRRAALLLNEKRTGEPVEANHIHLQDRMASAPDGRSVTFAEIGLDSLHHSQQEQIMAVASHVSPVSPPPFAAQFAEITVDIQTGQMKVDRLVIAVDSGTIINPVTAEGQIEGGVVQALGYALCEEMKYDSQGQPRERDLSDYHIHRANEIPDLTTIFVETFEPSHPFGAKATAEIPMDGVAPAIGNALADACGAQVDTIPIIPERTWRSIRDTENIKR
ncbi:xanthine dehydrogenase, molybdenum binding subunit apoprotein [Longilinea arvoryzae]|uniref:Xanthine dehydrogenase, molybdenum binding subunit apoprotein n=1 Tax=Longilinea arvoryzae TaxID=360412 RepID=A0A0S7BJ84_9CHLR|nr:molybdopterin cofactor-binding domain-containing protein [Longilinea arvoryzae]GAP14518.1 xanthine dehydrogenase, molybdenum binding subunit apoprotein [Longilinea arvoryzae]